MCNSKIHPFLFTQRFRRKNLLQLDLLANVCFLGHRSVVRSGFRAPPGCSCVTISLHCCLVIPGWDCSIDSRRYKIHKSNEAQVPENLMPSTKWPTGIASNSLSLRPVEPFQQFEKLSTSEPSAGDREGHTCKKTNNLICFSDQIEAISMIPSVNRHIVLTNGGKINVECPKVIDIKLSM